MTFTIGGNDAGFSKIGNACVAGPRIDPADPPYSLENCKTVIEEKEASGFEAIRAKLPIVLANIRASAPMAQIRIPLYPRFLRLTRGQNINLLLRGLYNINNTDRAANGLTAAQMLVRFIMGLNETIQETVEGQATTRVITDTLDALRGHRLGEANVQWVTGLATPLENSFHPNACGHIALARAVLPAVAPGVALPASC